MFAYTNANTDAHTNRNTVSITFTLRWQRRR
jgi:hypothetical protein